MAKTTWNKRLSPWSSDKYVFLPTKKHALELDHVESLGNHNCDIPFLRIHNCCFEKNLQWLLKRIYDFFCCECWVLETICLQFFWILREFLCQWSSWKGKETCQTSWTAFKISTFTCVNRCQNLKTFFFLGNPPEKIWTWCFGLKVFE